MLNIVNNPRELNYAELDKFQKADYDGQLKAAPVLFKLFGKYEDVVLEHHIVDRGRIDIFLTVNHKGIEHKYAIECKDRDYKSSDFEDAFLNPDKYGWLMSYKMLGYKPLFFNSFTDGKYAIWDVSTDEWEVTEEKVHKYSVDKSQGYVYEPRFHLPFDKVIYQGDLLGNEYLPW